MTAHIENFSGKVAVITGGASGIGFALAEAMGAAGAKIVIADIEQTALNKAVGRLRGSSIDCEGVMCDVAKADQVEALAATTYERFGAAHVVCNNAGVVTFKPVWEQTLDDWKWVVDIDLWGVIHGVHAFVGRMLASGEPGHFVNTASVAGLLGFPGISPYVAAKHAVVGLSESMLADFNAHNKPIGVSVLCPGQVRTQIYRSERNRDGYESPAENAAGIESRETIEPNDVAQMVMQAIRAGTFWILPHERYVDMYVANADTAARRSDPVVPGVDR